ncbi:ROK family protein [Streptomyces sp. NPDC047829]|uniref:ROK family transcriptional regulator n=1 Tax=Streptomyces sp. NPDC047829 TaxID=3154609 RepID=UPI0033F61CE3
MRKERPLPPDSAGRLLQLFRQGRVSTRRELGDATGLSRTTVTARVDQLIGAGFLREGGTASSSGGRPPTLLAFDDRTPTVLAADLGASRGRVAVTDAGGRILAEDVLESRIDVGPRRALSSACDAFEGLLERAARSTDSVCGIGIGVPGPVDFRAGRVVRPPVMPGWHGFDVRGFVRRRFDVPVLLDNDANMMAMGEYEQADPDTSSLIFVKVGTGVGSGIVVGGRLLRGVDGAEGDLGHVRVPGITHLCACGAVGCLAAGAGGSAICRDLRALGIDAGSGRDVVRLVRDGDRRARAAVQAAGALLGEVLATVVSLVNPRTLVFGGDIADTGEHFLRSVHEALLRRTQPLATRGLTLATSELGDRVGIAGATATVREQVFGAEAVDQRLSAR